ncbi:uncharacterized protein LOC130645813 [Hydractinia symbiolongicarpus]|uniref:uncharacterized protein LOC130645813 n=1 Tax=Hydractinia symbiolongicarpus TaxID=13093 RepID=UPI00255155FB|nr:uncharacterized protein LOC130645813 [Hydractinia symbiolongicarpus]
MLNNPSASSTTRFVSTTNITTMAPASMSVTASTSTLPFSVSPGLSITPRRFNHVSNRRIGIPANRYNSPKTRNGFLTFVYSNKTDASTPDIETKVNLLLAGLGEKRITFPFTESSGQFSEVLYQNFEKIRIGGGFELLRNERNCRELISIPVPAGGYNGQFVKTIFGQAKSFVRLILQNLLDDENSSLVTNNGN